MEMFWQDMRLAVRMLRKSPGFSTVTILTLALGIGANTAIFSLADAVLFRPLPVHEPERLVNLMVQFKGGPDPSFSYPLFEDYRTKNEVFTGLAGYVLASMHMSLGQESERIRGMLVSSNYFDVLGVRPVLGRSFAPDEGCGGTAGPSVIISYGLWQSRFGGGRDALGKEIHLNGRNFTIVGVAPREFTGNVHGLAAQTYVPMTDYSVDYPVGIGNPFSQRMFPWLQIVGRLKPGVSREQAQERMRALAAQIQRLEPQNTYTNLLLADGSRGYTAFVTDLERPLKLLQLLAALVLVIACANVGSLLIARAAVRRKEMAMRLVLGAGRGRLVRQTLTESILLAVAGGVAGLLVAVWLTGLLRSFRPALEVGAALDARVLLFTLAVAIATGVLFGLAPAWQAARTGLTAALKESPPAGRAWRWNLRSALVVAQIALSLVVLVAAGLAVKSLRTLYGIDSGLAAERVMLFSIDVGRGSYDAALRRSGYDDERGLQFFDALLERVRALPVVESAGLAAIRPLDGVGWQQASVPEGSVYHIEKPINLSLNAVTPGYFAAVGVPLLGGRDFNTHDSSRAARVGIANATLVRTFWPGHDGIGKRIQLGADPSRAQVVEVVGVVGDSKYRALSETVPPTLYLPLAQSYEPSLTLAVRSPMPAGVTESVRGAVRSLDTTLPVFAVRSLSDQIELSLSTPRMAASLLSLFGGLALLLGLLGLYGLVAWLVAQRTREIGIRMALGAQRGNILMLVLGHGLRMVAWGMALGLAATQATTNAMGSILHEVRPQDPWVLAGVAVVLAVAALAACYLPARRATRVDAMVALRYE